MRRKQIVSIGLVILFSSMVELSFGQYFSKLYDYDSTSDFGSNIFIQSDSNYFILGGGLNVHTFQGGLEWMSIKSDGSAVIFKNDFKSTKSSFYAGLFGRVKRLSSGGYLVPLTVHTPSTFNTKSAAGILVLKASGDTLLSRLYTDTTWYNDGANDAISISNHGYYFGGSRGSYALFTHTDTIGNLLWTKQFYKNQALENSIESISLIQNNRLLVGGTVIGPVYVNGTSYFYYRAEPWFMIMDTAGNILKDTLLSFCPQTNTKLAGGGNIFRDSLGGYIHLGYLDSMYLKPNPDEPFDFPGYVAHLDTNFKIEWIKVLPHGNNGVPLENMHVVKMLQTRDGNFLIIGDRITYTSKGNFYGWAAKMDRQGTILWNTTLTTDSNEQGYLVDAAERPDGNGYVFVGENRDGHLPSWHQQEVWIVSVDSNGCLMPGCAPTAVPHDPIQKDEKVLIYPNPTTGKFNLSAPSDGSLYLSDVQGRAVEVWAVNKGNNELTIPGKAVDGLYFGRFVSKDGRSNVSVKIIYKQ